MSDASATWPLFGEHMLAAAKSGVFEVLPPGIVVPLDIRGRPIAPVRERTGAMEIETSLGGVRHRSPPPDVARVLSSLALVAALLLSLLIQAFLGS